MAPDRNRGASRRAVAACVALAVASMLAACQSRVVTSDGRPLPPEPRPLPPPPPSEIKADRMTVRVGTKAVDDRDGNGYPEIIPVEAYLLAQAHPGPIHEPGAFVFALFLAGRGNVPDAEALARWRFEGEQVEQARMRHPLFGDGYAFRLSLAEAGGDEYPLILASLICRFEPADGRAGLAPGDAYLIQIGRRAEGARAER